jgi:hypothetical protein
MNLFLDETRATFGFATNQQLYDFMAVMDWMIQDFTLGGLTAKRTLTELVYGWKSTSGSPIYELNFSPEITSSDYYFLTGDAILYNDHITPLLEGGLTGPANPTV